MKYPAQRATYSLNFFTVELEIFPLSIPFQNQNVGYPTSKNDVKDGSEMGGLTL